MAYAMVISLCMILIVLLFGAPLHRLISGSDDPELTRLGVLYMRIEVGGFPVLLPGENSVTGSGWSAAIIEKRERYL